ncbi:hypothetical protein JCM15548_12791 [Geofilum rubicundum JCM 15548]|uniref:Glycosyltransferase RgtA/B/C/D-like domain-containing protein n=2 Tax=Geofilum TaxID=1236988 RepID=A0A0E9LZ42_9BACT|nr:hypothetical protein JCM15548_12791 [Geofilum rubicundum JCM 15548]
MKRVLYSKFLMGDQLKDIGAIFLAAIMLCFWSIYNGYPLFFSSDTAMYLEAAFAKHVGPDRPILYGLFMYYISGQYSLWFVVIVQSLILSYSFYCWFRYFLPGENYLLFFLLYSAFVSIFMGASFNVSWLMPDVFTPLSVLSIGLIIFAPRLPRHVWVFLIGLSILGIAMHNSHLFVCLGLTLLLLAGYAFKSVREIYNLVGIKFSRIAIVIGLIITSAFFAASISYQYGGGFKSSRGGTVFLMGSLVEMGVVDIYLGENCSQKDYRICEYRDTIPNNFLWASNSPIYQTGGWAGSEAEYSAIVNDILTTPKYLKLVVWKSILRTISQFMHFDTGEATKATPRIDQGFRRFYPNEYDNYYKARQNQGELNFKLVNHTQVVIFLSCILLYALIYYKNGMSLKFRFLILFLLIALLINAWVCGTFSGVYFRYQARLLWLIPMPVFLFLATKIRIRSTEQPKQT